ncbi:MAG: hypothetical protein HKN64_08605 [Woeseiaceae bacterium]|nr:hypothetical protein [Woeseiaceae bacterium]
MSEATLDHLVTHYGAQATDVLSLAREQPGLLQVMGENHDTIEAEAVYCARCEHVRHLDDFVFRRTGLGTLGNPGRSVLERAARLLAGELGWSSSRITREVEQTLARFPVDYTEAHAA